MEPKKLRAKKLPIPAAILLTILLCPAATATQAFAATDTVQGPALGLFGKPTSVEPIAPVEAFEKENINRSKDSAVIPPAFASPMANVPGTGDPLTPFISGYSPQQASESAPLYVSAESIYPASPASGSAASENRISFTLPDGLFYEDGSLGTLRIPKIALTVKVYEGEDLETLSKGAGHFKSTSVWAGNVAVAGHNRGKTYHFKDIHTLKTGDIILYDTKLGSRTYAVSRVEKISETDLSWLARSDDNIITLITCVTDSKSQRWAVRASEVK
jgi:sortase A